MPNSEYDRSEPSSSEALKPESKLNPNPSPSRHNADLEPPRSDPKNPSFTPSRSDSDNCAHCGLPATFEADGHPFCCHGCHQAFLWLSEAQLDDYYQQKRRFASSSAAANRGSNTTAPVNYAHLDDPEYLESLGHQLGECTLNVVGLSCPACVWLLEKLPEKVPGLRGLRVDLGQAKATIAWDPKTLPLSELAALTHTLGYELIADDQRSSQAQKQRRRAELIRIAVAGAAAGNVMLVSLALYGGQFPGLGGDMSESFRHYFRLLAAVLALPAVSYGAWPFLRAAFAALSLGRLHLDVPITLGIVGGYVASLVALFQNSDAIYFDSLSTLVFLLLVGRYIQGYGQQWALGQVAALNLLLPPSATVWEEGEWAQRSRNKLRVGDLILLRPHEACPADALCIEGTSHVDNSSLTGESLPQAVQPQSMLLAGALNLEAELQLRVLATEADTRLGQVAQSLQQKTGPQTSTQLSVDKIARFFVIAVLAITAIAGLVWWQLATPQRSFEVMLSVLVVCCPCALGLATPLALALGRAKAAREGILFHHSASLEGLSTISRIAFDKTGTLTTATLGVQSWHSAIPENKLRAIVEQLEAQSAHPIGKALRKWAQDSSFAPSNAQASPGHHSSPAIAIEAITGQGVQSHIESDLYRIGRFRDDPFIQACALWNKDHRFDKLAQQGHSVVYLQQNDSIVAAWALQDQIRPGATELIEDLQNRGFEISLISGDAKATVQHYAQRLGIQDHYGEQLPEDKADIMHNKAPWIMIGDGVNDAVALQSADIGIAVGGSAQIAIRVADVHLARYDITRLQRAFALARETRSIVLRNLTIALLYNLIFASAAVLGWIDPLVAAIIMPISSLTVVGLSGWSLTTKNPS